MISKDSAPPFMLFDTSGDAWRCKVRVERSVRYEAAAETFAFSTKIQPSKISNSTLRQSMMRRVFFGLVLLPLVACSGVFAGDALAPSSDPGGAPAKLSRDDGQPHHPKGNKRVSKAQRLLPLLSAGPMRPNIQPLSLIRPFPDRRRLRAKYGPASTWVVALAPPDHKRNRRPAHVRLLPGKADNADRAR
jgi:hypothetical protein